MMLLPNLFSFKLLIQTCAIHQLINSAKQNYLNMKFPTRQDARLLQKDLLSARNDLMCKLKCIYFNHVLNLFYQAVIKLFENTTKFRIRSLVTYLTFLVKVSFMTQIKLSITFPVKT